MDNARGDFFPRIVAKSPVGLKDADAPARGTAATYQ